MDARKKITQGQPDKGTITNGGQLDPQMGASSDYVSLQVTAY